MSDCKVEIRMTLLFKKNLFPFYLKNTIFPIADSAEACYPFFIRYCSTTHQYKIICNDWLHPTKYIWYKIGVNNTRLESGVLTPSPYLSYTPLPQPASDKKFERDVAYTGLGICSLVFRAKRLFFVSERATGTNCSL